MRYPERLSCSEIEQPRFGAWPSVEWSHFSWFFSFIWALLIRFTLICFLSLCLQWSSSWIGMVLRCLPLINCLAGYIDAYIHLSAISCFSCSEIPFGATLFCGSFFCHNISLLLPCSFKLKVKFDFGCLSGETKPSNYRYIHFTNTQSTIQRVPRLDFIYSFEAFSNWSNTEKQ